MRDVSYQDGRGRWHKVLLPEGVPDSHIEYAIDVGPPDLDSLGLPEDVTTRLHNQLYWRGLYTFKEVRSRRQEVLAALQAAYQVDIVRLSNLFQEEFNG